MKMKDIEIMNNAIPKATIVAVFSTLVASVTQSAEAENSEWRLKILEQSEKPLVTKDHPDAADNKYGFEGGKVIKCDGFYHWFPSEMSGDPYWVKVRIAYWRSKDGDHWERIATVYESDGINSQNNPRSSFWSPMPVFNEAENRWNLFYISYRGPKQGEIGKHHSGKLWRATSQTPGRAGIAGPYEPGHVIIEKDATSEPWEGQQGPASVSPYRLESGGWASFYCGHNYKPRGPWLAGIITAPELKGPWKRRPELSPSTIHPAFVENPIVHKMPSGPYIAVYDSGIAKADELGIGFSYSDDGLHWARGSNYPIVTEDKTWEKLVRTPLGLIPEEDGTYTVFYTAGPKEGKFHPLSRLKVKIVQGE